MRRRRIKQMGQLLANETGALYAWMLFLLPIFLLIMGLVTDLASLYSLTRRVQTALDVAGTSALCSSIIEESIVDGSLNPEVDEDKVREAFFRLLRQNLRLNEGWAPGVDYYLEAPLVVQEAEIQVKGPPTISATVQVAFRTTIFRFLVEEVKIPIHSESMLDMK